MSDCFVKGCLISLILLLMVPVAQAEVPALDPAATVIAFNAAIPEGDLDTIVGLLADGGMQFTIKSPHEGLVPEKLTTSIVPYWKMIAPVIATSTSIYEREVEIIDARQMGNIATVWAGIDTRSQFKGKEEIKTASYNHVYLLIQTPDGWKIASIADNRAIDNLNN
jgi:hypothetical protein